MSYFTKEYLKFFQELEKNNRKDWFSENKSRYEQHVKRPFNDFVEVMITRIRADDPEVTIGAKEAVFRINRDIRFSKEKSPYKTHMAAIVSKEGRRSKEWPGFYLQFAPDRLRVGGGAYLIEAESLYRIRRFITNNLATFKKLQTAKTFKTTYAAVQGERNKILPPEFRQAVEKEPLVANKQFYFMADLAPRVLLEKNLPDLLMKYYLAGRGINSFLKSALTT